ncbi:MAG: phage major capsid protein [Candidatus Lokiarchaeota archaeon]|nr:phage major capsid protein [Candidatus Lokiarchaeota archaeon]
MDNALKAIARTDDELRVGNYIVLFGGRDLEGIASPRKNKDGTVGEYFTPQTQLESRFTKAGRLPVDWEHNAAPEGEDVGVLGFVDWSTVKADEAGVWVERVLNRRSQYVQMLEQLIDAGLIGNSSEADPGGVEKADDGAILRWPLVADTLTVTPMEPRMLSENALQAAKALGLFAEDKPEPEADAEAVDDGAEAGKATDETQLSQEDKDMAEQLTEARLVEILGGFKGDVVDAAKTAAEDAIKAWSAAQPVESPGVVVEDEDELVNQHDNREDRPFKSMGEFFKTVAQDPRDARLRQYKSNDPADEGGFNFTAFAGPEKVGSLSAAKAKAISGASETVPAHGGILVDTDRSTTIMERVYAIGELLQRVSVIPVSGNANGMTVYGVDETSRANGSRLGGVQSYWVSEAEEITSSKPKFREIDLKLKKVAALVYATDELLQDASALESWVMSRLPDELRFRVEDAIINGTGAGMPLGVLQCDALISVTKETGQAADTIYAENISKMWARRWAPSGRNMVWLHNQDTEPELDKLSYAVGTGGSLVYMPPGGLSGAPYGRIKGRPVIPTEYNPTLGDVGDLMLFDPTQYQMIDKGGVQSAASIHVRFIYDEQVFRFIYRVDGQPLWHSALTPFKGTDTQSPYIAIAERA